MRNHLLQLTVAIATCCIISFSAFSQSVTLSGVVKNSANKEAIPAVSVSIKGTGAGTFTDDKGFFKLVTTKSLPLTLVFTSIGFESKEISITSETSNIQVDLAAASALGTEVVVSASRVPERILESPVSIERVGLSAIRSTPATSYYDVIRTLKGVDVTTSSLTFASVTTRGFNGSGNTRFNQFVDGMDNQAPGLNFSVGAIVGLTELDVDNMELLPGASSALYGSGGMNGTLLINSKDPFKYPGISAQVKMGAMHLGSKGDPIGASPYYDLSLRWAQKIGDRFAFKISAQYIQAKDWVATDSTNYTGQGAGSQSHTIPGTRNSDPNYNGVNTYGDETSVDIRPFLQGALASNPGLAPIIDPLLGNPYYVSRTGYKENEIIDNNTISFKVSGGLYYKLTPKTELSLTGNFGTGNSVYTGSDRYSLKDLKIGQYKVEVKNDKWFLRAYTTQENSGNAFNATIASQLFNEAWKPSYNPANAAGSWYPQYTGALIAALAGGAPYGAANVAARGFADQGRPVAGSAQFNSIFNQVVSVPIPQGGKFLDRSDMYQAEGQYNLTDVVKFAEVLVGASWRQYVLNSQGTLFADSAGRIHTNEYGAYLQIAKRFFEDRLKLTASGRYDKNDNFEGKFTPRFSAVVTVAKDQNIRASYQNAYRFPSNQNQWINLNTGAGILLGGLPQLREFYHFDSEPVYTLASVAAYQQTGDPSVLKVATFGQFKPESVNSFEMGYKGLFAKRLLVDVYGYYSGYKNFIGRTSVYQLSTATGYSVSVNSSNTVNTYGFGASIDYLLPKNFSFNINVSSDHIDNPDPTFVTYFNTPDYRFNLGLSNSGFGHEKRFGFSVQYRWQDSYYTESDFKQGNVSAFGTIDGQVSYKLTNIRSLIKLGATNILNHYYVTQYGNPSIGGLYYISFGYNVF